MDEPKENIFCEKKSKLPTQKNCLETIADPWYFGRVVVPQRLINLSLYQEILLLQKFNDIGGKVLKPKKSASNLRKKMRPCMIVSDCTDCIKNLGSG